MARPDTVAAQGLRAAAEYARWILGYVGSVQGVTRKRETRVAIQGGEMKERPILFNGEMVRAILDGRKTQTRRVIKQQPSFTDGPHRQESNKNEFAWCSGEDDRFQLYRCPYGQIGDRLWGRETWCHKWDNEGPVFNEDGDYDPSCIWYRATTPDVMKLDEDCEEVYLKDGSPASPWMPSIHMPRWASRIQLEITDIRVERVQEIGHEDAIAEGIERNILGWIDYSAEDRLAQSCGEGARSSFSTLWGSINAKRGYGWDVNPWVWCISFKEAE